jgi:hypothetical protein
MKVSQLLEEQHIFRSAKDELKELKALAARYQLALKAGMGWPNIAKDGAWFGAGLAPLKGISDEDAMLSISKRRIAFIRALAKRLEGYVAEGRVVKIGRGRERSAHTEDAIPGQIERQLTDNLVDTHPPGGRPSDGTFPTVVWFISAPAGTVTSSFVELHTAKASGPNEWSTANLVLSLPNDPAFEKALTAWATSVMQAVKFVEGKGWVNTPRKRSHLMPALVDDLIDLFHKLGGHYKVKKLDYTPPSSHPQYTFGFQKKRAVGKHAVVLPIDPLIPVFKKHGLTL